MAENWLQRNGGLIGGAAALIPEIFRFISGNSQVRRGREMAANNKRGVYQRPNEVGQALSLAERAYLNNSMPGSALAKANIGTAAANQLNRAEQYATDSGDLLDAASKIDYQEGQALNGLAADEATFKNQQLAGLENQLANSAQYADKEFAYNVDAPYQEKAAAASALMGAGNTNVGNAINNTGGVITGALMNGLFDNEARAKTKMLSGPANYNGQLANPANYLNATPIYDPITKRIKYS